MLAKRRVTGEQHFRLEARAIRQFELAPAENAWGDGFGPPGEPFCVANGLHPARLAPDGVASRPGNPQTWLMLVGRDAELERISQLVDDAAEGQGGTLVLRGEAGIGKSSLLDHARSRAVSTVISTSGTEAESAIPFAGLGDVLRPLLGSLDSLAGPHAAAIRAVLGLSEPHPVDRLTLGAATLSLLAAAAPVLVLVDDAHWLDAESQDALVFAARRLAADPVALLFAAREGDLRRFEADGLDELVVGGLAPKTRVRYSARGCPRHASPTSSSRAPAVTHWRSSSCRRR